MESPDSTSKYLQGAPGPSPGGLESRDEHIVAVLRAVRQVNKLIVHERETKRLIQRACDLLAGTLGYRNACIALTNGDQKPHDIAHAGYGELFEPAARHLSAGKWIPCAWRALMNTDAEACSVPCPDCPAGGVFHTRLHHTVLTRRLEFDNHIYGVLSVFVPDEFAGDRAEMELFEELAEDFSFALHRIRMDQRLMETEEQLRQAQKMEAIGQLAGGVAHDFNNILQAMMGYSELARRHARDAGDALRECLDEVFKGTERASALTRQLLAFSRRQLLTPKDIDINDIVENLLKMIRRTIGEHIELEFTPDSESVMVHADPGQVEQVLMNLCVNARDAMPDGGRLVMETGRVELDEAACEECPEFRPGRFASLTVSDTGVGMDAETRRRIFEPFFTTKEVGRGTGLGLATVFGIVKQHEGMIEVDSKPGEGATFRVYLPLIEARRVAEKKTVPKDVKGGRETILVAEDDAVIRKLTERILRGAGYRILLARNGEEAFAIIDRRGGEIDLALLDIVMPRHSGKDVFERFRKARPDARAIFMSGYSTGVIEPRYLEERDVGFVQKPFAPNDLLGAIRRTLDS